MSAIRCHCGSYGFVSLFANHTRSEGSQTDVFLGWTMPMGNRRSVGSSLSYRPDQRDR